MSVVIAIVLVISVAIFAFFVVYSVATLSLTAYSLFEGVQQKIERGDRFQGAVVHSLWTNVEPVLVEFCVGHTSGDFSFFALQPLFNPLAQLWVSVERHARPMHVKRCAHSFMPLSK